MIKACNRHCVKKLMINFQTRQSSVRGICSFFKLGDKQG